jgi:hypothetical protein
MTRTDLINKVALAFADVEGFDVTEEQAKDRKIVFPTRPQRLCNPGDIRHWMHDGKHYPENSGYVDFLLWANGDQEAAISEGWRVLKVLVGQYVDGHYTKAQQPTLVEAVAAYAPAADGNNPGSYTRTVGAKIGLPINTPLITLIDE